MKPFRLVKGGLQDRFLQSRAKVQIFGGGFGNGKTTASILKCLQLMRDYPGCNGLIGRGKKLDIAPTVRAEFKNWCPPNWIEQDVKSDDNNHIKLINGSVVNFKQVSQSVGQGESTSNLLSANYDFIYVDQFEDPYIVEKDFDDLFGRLRGTAKYVGDDPTMPETGPRWIILTCNPTSNWFYNKVIRPIHETKRMRRNHPDLLVDASTGEPMVELFEGPTTANAENLPDDFLRALFSRYKGQMRDRFIFGKWASYEGLVYPQFDTETHLLPHDWIEDHYNTLSADFVLTIIEGYDDGMAVPSCYLLAFIDPTDTIFVMDGFYAADMTLDAVQRNIDRIRDRYGIVHPKPIHADPSIFRRTRSGRSGQVGVTTAEILDGYGIKCRRGNADIQNGIRKVRELLTTSEFRRHPVTGKPGAPRLFFSDELDFLSEEMGNYFWKRDAQTKEYIDEPIDRNDHSMDALKYLLSDLPPPGMAAVIREERPPAYMLWRELEEGSRVSRRNG